MTRARRDGLYLLLLGNAVFLLSGFAFWRISPDNIQDFKGVYYGTRCLIEHHDPYQESEMYRVYTEGGGTPISEATKSQARVVMWQVYLPTTYLAISPLAMFACSTANALWMILTAVGLICATFLMWRMSADSAPILSGMLIGFLLANCGVLLATGNLAGIVASLCIFAVWSFLNEKFVPAGIGCLAISLVLKPHDTGFVWLYFLLAGRANRRRALHTLLAVGVLALTANIWISQVSPHWTGELYANLSRYSARGQLDDLGPAGVGKSALEMKIGLQTIISVFWDDPRFYNYLTYLICGTLILAWGIKTLRSEFSQREAWFAFAAIAPLTMLVTYHRSYDAKILLLTVPACAMLWANGGAIRWIAAAVNVLGFVLTGEIPMQLIDNLDRRMHLAGDGFSGRLQTILFMRPISLILLIMAAFYCWVYVRKKPGRDQAIRLEGDLFS